MATDKQLKKAATELNDVMGLTPEINVKGGTEELTKGIKAAMKYVTPEDEFSDETQAVLDEMTASKSAKAAPAPAAKKKAAPVVVEEEDDEDEAEEEDDEEEEEVVAPPKKGKKAPVVVEEDDEEDEEEEIPAPKAKKKAAPAPAPVAKAKKKVVVEEDEEDEDEEEEVTPVKKGKAAPVEKAKVVKKAFVRSEFNRLDCVLITLKEKKPKTIAEWITKANALCITKGIKDNELQTKHLVINYGASLKHLDLDIKVPSK